MSKSLNIAGNTVTPNGTHITKEAKELSKEKIKQFIEQETKMVRGTFICFETPGASATISVKKYPGIPMFKKTMKDGETYEVPLYVARFLNGIDITAGALDNMNKANPKIGTCSYAVHGWKMDNANDIKQGIDTGDTVVPRSGVAKYVKRYGFNSTEFSGDF